MNFKVLLILMLYFTTGNISTAFAQVYNKRDKEGKPDYKFLHQ